mgnify:CR=1 FL=1
MLRSIANYDHEQEHDYGHERTKALRRREWGLCDDTVVVVLTLFVLEGGCCAVSLLLVADR